MPINSDIFRLRNFGLPVIQDINDFADAMRLTIAKVTQLHARCNNMYNVYEIDKKGTSKKRIIAQPSRELKAIQSWILRNILDRLSTSSQSKGFDKGTSILDNATPHVGFNYILNVDLEDFFPSIHAQKVFNIFLSVGYNRAVSSILTRFCVYDNRLPQGSPASPKLANLICAKLDWRIHNYVGPKGIIYTRYADDLTLSSQNILKLTKVKQFIGTIIADEGFAINKRKTKISGTMSKKTITGLVLSEKNAGIGRTKCRILRSQLHKLFCGEQIKIDYINGQLAFIYGVDKNSYRKIYAYIEKLKTKYNDNELTGKLHKEKRR